MRLFPVRTILLELPHIHSEERNQLEPGLRRLRCQLARTYPSSLPNTSTTTSTTHIPPPPCLNRLNASSHFFSLLLVLCYTSDARAWWRTNRLTDWHIHLPRDRQTDRQRGHVQNMRRRSWLESVGLRTLKGKFLRTHIINFFALKKLPGTGKKERYLLYAYF